jgi:hypothetical protein
MQPYGFANGFTENTVQPSPKAADGSDALIYSLGDLLRGLCAFGDRIGSH